MVTKFLELISPFSSASIFNKVCMKLYVCRAIRYLKVNLTTKSKTFYLDLFGQSYPAHSPVAGNDSNWGSVLQESLWLVMLLRFLFHSEDKLGCDLRVTSCQKHYVLGIPTLRIYDYWWARWDLRTAHPLWLRRPVVHTWWEFFGFRCKEHFSRLPMACVTVNLHSNDGALSRRFDNRSFQ